MTVWYYDCDAAFRGFAVVVFDAEEAGGREFVDLASRALSRCRVIPKPSFIAFCEWRRTGA